MFPDWLKTAYLSALNPHHSPIIQPSIAKGLVHGFVYNPDGSLDQTSQVPNLVTYSGDNDVAYRFTRVTESASVYKSMSLGDDVTPGAADKNDDLNSLQSIITNSQRNLFPEGHVDVLPVLPQPPMFPALISDVRTSDSDIEVVYQQMVNSQSGFIPADIGRTFVWKWLWDGDDFANTNISEAAIHNGSNVFSHFLFSPVLSKSNVQTLKILVFHTIKGGGL